MNETLGLPIRVFGAADAWHPLGDTIARFAGIHASKAMEFAKAWSVSAVGMVLVSCDSVRTEKVAILGEYVKGERIE